MSDTPQVINTLRTKAKDLEALIRKLETATSQARSDLAHINASIRLFSAPEEGNPFPVHMNLGLMFKSKELGKLSREALATGNMSTRDLAVYVIKAKGFDENDKHLRSSIALRIVNAMRMAEKRRQVQRVGKDGAAIVWGSMPCPTLQR